MKKMFIDTNKYLDFYRYKEENLEILNELEKCDNIILIEQVIDEFKRNRNKEITSLKEKIKTINNKIDINTFSLEPIGIYNSQIKDINSFSSKKITEIKSKIQELYSSIENITTDDNLDKVNTVFEKIKNNQNTITYKHSEKAYSKAIIRNNLGGIPRSDKNGYRTLTICDEYIWETLLENSKYDICFITRDKTYLENKNILTQEYQTKTGKMITFFEDISEGLEYLGKEISNYAKELEQINNIELQEKSIIQNEKMTETQQNIYNYAMNLTKEQEKQVLVITGSPGTGKTFLATNMLIGMVDKSLKTTFVTKNSSSRKIFYENLKGKYSQKYLSNLTRGSGTFFETETNSYDCIIVDDANHLQAKSGLFKNNGENQIMEIINATKLSIFFIDETNKITVDDIGSIDEIKKYAIKLNAKFNIIQLDKQFRYNQNEKYIDWLNYVLQITPEKPCSFDFEYDFKVIDNPNEMRNKIEEKNKINNKSRIVAGYCWDWLNEGKNKSEIHDIKISEYNFEMSWNLGNTQSWALDPNSVNEAGCIYTCQGAEFDYVGVIIGNDMQYLNEKIITDYTKRAKTDTSLRGLTKNYKNNQSKIIADQIIKSTYQTLMTRGKKGCYVYCLDKNLSDYLKQKSINN